MNPLLMGMTSVQDIAEQFGNAGVSELEVVGKGRLALWRTDSTKSLAAGVYLDTRGEWAANVVPRWPVPSPLHSGNRHEDILPGAALAWKCDHGNTDG